MYVEREIEWKGEKTRQGEQITVDGKHGGGMAGVKGGEEMAGRARRKETKKGRERDREVRKTVIGLAGDTLKRKAGAARKG